MSTLEVREVDAHEPAFDHYHAVYAAAVRHGPPGEFATPWQLEEARSALADPDQRTVRRAWVGLLGGRAVATGWLEGSTVDNTGVASVRVTCHPAHRGHGYGAELLAHVEGEARSLGRARLLAEVEWPYAGGADGAASTDLAWARRHGYELGLVDVQRRLELPVPDAVLDELAAEAATHHAGYELRSFSGRVPDDLVEAWAVLTASIDTEAPTGDIEREATTVDVSAVRALEELLARQGREKVNTVAIAPDGDVVAYSDVAVTVHESERAYQWGTLVRADHRGHRLGLAVKVANLRLLRQTHPQVTTVVTYNAEVNGPMIAVNERLGFRPVQWLGELQKRL